MWDLRGGQVSHEKKQQRIGRNVQIKIDEAMHQKASRSQETRELQGPGKGVVELAQSFYGFAE